MGGAVSAGADNDELIDNLLEADYIKSNAVERVFRAVDRGHYFTVDYKERAYRDTAWKFGNLHISAPCIYSRVMENLKLGPGMSFLNLGSGTGYLSTMAGLILGSYGVNHGIEIHEDVINYATKKLEEFTLTSSAVDEYEFCPPKFFCGNCLTLGSGARQYDRVYCGAACPESQESYMKNLIKVGGILVMPINDQLLQICRTSDTNWESKSVLPVSFATLISTKYSECGDPLKIPEEDPLTLQEICRFVVRSILRKVVDLEHPELKKPPRMPRKKVKKKTFRKLVIPIFNSNSDGEDDHDILQPSSIRNSRGFVMDVDNVETCGSLIEWQILQEPNTPPPVVGAPESVSGMNNTDNVSTSKVDMDFDLGSDSGTKTQTQDRDNSSLNMYDEGSDEEFLSDLEEFQRLFAKAKQSTSGCKSSEVVNKDSGETGSSSNEKSKTEEKPKREKVDSGIVEDIESGKEIILESDEDCENLDQCPFLRINDSELEESSENSLMDDLKDKEKASTSTPQANPTPVVNYTTYMREKIKLLPLPLTLKYFLNLNREL